MGWACGIMGFTAGLYWMGAQAGAHPGAQVVAQLVAQEEDFFLKQSNRPHFFLGWVAQAWVVQSDLQPGAQDDLGAQPLLQDEDFLHLKQSKRPFLWEEPQPLGAQLVGVVQTGFEAGPQLGLGAQLVAQDDFLHLKQSKRPFLWEEPQPLGAQLVGVVQTDFPGPQFGAQLVEHDDLLPFRQSNKPHFFLGWVAQATGGLQDFDVAHAFPLCENRPADTTLVNPSEATVARLMQRIHFIVPCLLPLGLFREPSEPIRERGLRWWLFGGLDEDRGTLHSNRPRLPPPGSPIENPLSGFGWTAKTFSPRWPDLTSGGIRDLRDGPRSFRFPECRLDTFGLWPDRFRFCRAGGRYRRVLGNPLSISSREIPK
jgi:hypothetical protein